MLKRLFKHDLMQKSSKVGPFWGKRQPESESGKSQEVPAAEILQFRAIDDSKMQQALLATQPAKTETGESKAEAPAPAAAPAAICLDDIFGEIICDQPVFALHAN